MLIDATLSPPEIDLLPQADLSQTVCIVFDVLRATSSMITGLAHGVQEIRPVLSIEEALATRQEWPGAVLGGERFGDKIDGFDLGNSPLEYRHAGVERVITTTTNGTVALRACAAAAEVWAGALLNLQALEERLRAQAPARVMMVCAGTFRELALEDVFAAGMLIAAFPEAEWTDSARTARAVFGEYQPGTCSENGNLYDSAPGILEAAALAALQASKNGRSLRAKGRASDVEWCAQVSRFPVVGILKNGILRAERACGV